MRLPRKASIRLRSEFAKVRQHGKSSAGRYLVLGALHDPELDRFKVGYITTRKIGKAVERNHIRRRFRAIVNQHGHRILPGFYLVTIARYRAPGATFDELERDWLKQARRLKILSD